MQRPFVKGLAQELWTGPTVVDPALLSTAFDDWGDAAVALNLMSRSISVAASSERGNQSWCHSGTCTREGIEDDEIRMRLRELLDLRIV